MECISSKNCLYKPLPHIIPILPLFGGRIDSGQIEILKFRKRIPSTTSFKSIPREIKPSPSEYILPITSIGLEYYRFRQRDHRLLLYQKLIPLTQQIVILPEKDFAAFLQEKDHLTKRFEILKEEIIKFQKQTTAQKGKDQQIYRFQLLKNLVSILQELERAKSFFSISQAKSEQVNIEIFHQVQINLNMIYNKCLQILGITAIVPHLFDSFNPIREKALFMRYTPQIPPNYVVEIIRPGYTLNEDLLCPAEVILSTDNPTHLNLEPQSMKVDNLSQAKTKDSWFIWLKNRILRKN